MEAKRIARIALMTALTIIGAYITIPIPNLPFTLQTFFALLAGLLLSRKDAVISQILYILLGLFGLPIFAFGGGGIGYVLMPSFGYILSLPILALVSASLKDKNVYLGSLLALVITLIFGGIWLIGVSQMYLYKGVIDILLIVFLIYIPVELVKGVLAIFVWKRLKNIL